MRNWLCVMAALLAMGSPGTQALAVQSDAGSNSGNPRGANADINSGGGQQSLFNEPLFGEALFPDDGMKDRLDGDIREAQRREQPAQPAAMSVEQKIQNSQIDQEMRNEISKAAQWLFYYQLRNRQEFPGVVGDNQYAAQVQLSELVPNNPYAYGNTKTIVWGMPASYNGNGSPATGSVVWNDNWTNHLQAQQNNRVQLSMDYGITPPQIDAWAQDPPETWTAAPGSIIAVGNNQGLFYVWGAGADGKPVRNPANGKAFVVSGRTSGTVNDQIAPNGV